MNFFKNYFQGGGGERFVSIIFADATQSSGNKAISTLIMKKSQLPAAGGYETEGSELFQSAVIESSNKAEGATSLRCCLSKGSTRGS